MVKFVCYALRFVADAEARMIAQESSGGISDEISDEDDDDDDTSSGDEDDDDISDSDDNRPANQQGSSRKEKDMMKDARELFRWTIRQKELVEALWGMLDSDADNDNAQREAQLEVLLDLLASFLFTSTGDKPFSSGLVHFLAVLGIDSDTNCLRTAKNYSYMLAGVVYCMRVLSVEHLLPSAARDEQTNEDRERFLQHREKYLADGSYSPMSEALSLLAYGKHVALAARNAGNAY
jgi:hypothetical protein